MRGKFLTSKPSRPHQSHWNEIRDYKELIKTVSYWHRFFPTCFISLNWLQTLDATVMERIWTVSRVCFPASTSTSGYCNLIFLAATLCCDLFLSGEKLCSSSLCRWMCVDDPLCHASYLLPGCSLPWTPQQGECSSMHVPALASITWAQHECTFLFHSYPVKGAVLWWNKAEVVECFCDGRK